MVYLKNHNIHTTKSSAETLVSKNKYLKPLIARGGSRDHSHDEKSLFLKDSYQKRNVY